jgi:hypothetical protein
MTLKEIKDKHGFSSYASLAKALTKIGKPHGRKYSTGKIGTIIRDERLGEFTLGEIEDIRKIEPEFMKND